MTTASSPAPVSMSSTDPAAVVSEDLVDMLSAAASYEESGVRAISQSIGLLRKAGALLDDGREHPELIARSLMRVASANLSVGRLLEGHINALLLVRLYAPPHVKSRIHQQILEGAFLGVWGADGQVPVTYDPQQFRLTGAKKFASGIGTVTHAIVTVDSGPQVRLALVDVRNGKRANPSAWDMCGMTATASGTYDLTGLRLESFDWIGAPGDYLSEPHFVGGVWRIAALQVGASVGLIDRAAAQLRASGRMRAQPQQARLMTVLMRAWAGVALVERAAVAVSDRKVTAEQVVSSSVAARIFTEEVGLDAIRAVEQALGLQHFETHSDTGRMARDLSVYLRQAARDAFVLRSAEFALGQEGRVWGAFK